jgi:hypothetical protein
VLDVLRRLRECGQTAEMVYAANPIKRQRATQEEMRIRADFLIGYANEHGPVTVRGLYYQSEVAALPGITKDGRDYDKIQRQVLALRRAGEMPYEHIADATRWMRKPKSYSSVEEALRSTAALYRKSLWNEVNATVEIWCEKDAVAGTIYPVTSAYDVPLMVARGFSSETFCFEAVQDVDPEKPYYVYYLGDYDRAGQDAARSLQEKLERFADERGVAVFFETIAVDIAQIVELGLPTREPKRNTEADKRWPYAIACELDAIPPHKLRDIVEQAIKQHLPARQLEVLKVAEESERFMLRGLVDRAVARRRS